MKGKLVLETGNVFEGNLLIGDGIKTGVVVFDTRVVGYERVLTSPDYYGKIVCFTYPLIGNYGINYEDIETDRIFPSGIVISEYSEIYSNFRAKSSLKEFLKGNDISILEGIDTQYITTIIRENRGIKGAIAPATADEREIQKRMKEKRDFDFSVEEEILKEKDPYIAVVNPPRKSEISFLSLTGKKLVFVNVGSSEIRNVLSNAKGIYLSSSFEDINYIKKTAEIISEFIGVVPVFGKGSGHLAVALALGGKISEDSVNHYGVNHPVKDIKNDKRYITEQSHSFIVEKGSVNDRIRFINITDGSVEGIADRNKKVLSVAFQPTKEIIEEFSCFL